jgi:hypothetical protein
MYFSRYFGRPSEQEVPGLQPDRLDVLLSEGSRQQQRAQNGTPRVQGGRKVTGFKNFFFFVTNP